MAASCPRVSPGHAALAGEITTGMMAGQRAFTFTAASLGEDAVGKSYPSIQQGDVERRSKVLDIFVERVGSVSVVITNHKRIYLKANTQCVGFCGWSIALSGLEV